MMAELVLLAPLGPALDDSSVSFDHLALLELSCEPQVGGFSLRVDERSRGIAIEALMHAEIGFVAPVTLAQVSGKAADEVIGYSDVGRLAGQTCWLVHGDDVLVLVHDPLRPEARPQNALEPLVVTHLDNRSARSQLAQGK